MQRTPAGDAAASDVAVAEPPEEHHQFRRPPAVHDHLTEDHSGAAKTAWYPTGERERISFGVTGEPISGNVSSLDESAPGEPPPITGPGRFRPRTVVIAAIVALVLAGGVIAGVNRFLRGDRTVGAMVQPTVATAPLAGWTTGTFDLAAATRRTTVRVRDLGDDLFRITVPENSGLSPRPAISDGRVQLLLAPVGGDVEVLLSDRVTWGLRFSGGADRQTIDLTGGRVSAVDLDGASRRVALTLPSPSGTVPLRVTGAIGELSIGAPADGPVRVTVHGGVRTVRAGARTLTGLGGGARLTPRDWPSADRYDATVESRLDSLRVQNEQ